MTAVGDKFYFEIGEVIESTGKKYYRAKGFNALLFDDEGIRRLNKLTTPQRSRIKTIQPSEIVQTPVGKGQVTGIDGYVGAGGQAEITIYLSHLSDDYEGGTEL